MENEDVIREQMEDTRTSLSEKLESLEKQVASTVQGATSNVAETVEAVKDTVEAVKDTVQGTVHTVKESVEETLSSVKETVHEGWSAVKGMLDVPGFVEAYPWPMFGGSVALGFLLESLVVPSGAEHHGSRSHRGFPPDHISGEDRFESMRPAVSSSSSTGGGLFQAFQPEISRLKGLALGAVMSGLRDVIVNALPENMADKVAEVLDGFAHKLGGEMFEAQSPSKGNGAHTGNGRTPEKAATES